jgi:hypothetical protein
MKVHLLTDGREFDDDGTDGPGTYKTGDLACFDEDILLVVEVEDENAEAIPHPMAHEIMKAALEFGGPGPEGARAGWAEARRIHETVKLRVWTVADEEWVIAYSAEDAAIVFAETGASPIEGLDGKPEPWTPCDDEEVFTFRDEDDEGRPRETRKTMREHAAERGRGYFGTANF